MNMNIINYLKWFSEDWLDAGAGVRRRYQAFKSLLAHDKNAHEQMAALEEIYYRQLKVDLARVQDAYEQLAGSVQGLITDLLEMAPGRYSGLPTMFRRLDQYVRFMLMPQPLESGPPYTLPLTEIPLDAPELVGGKAFHLGTLHSKCGLPVPAGFVITTRSFQRFFEFNGLARPIQRHLARIDVTDSRSLGTASDAIRRMILAAPLPPEVARAVEDAHRALLAPQSNRHGLALRSSAVAEDAVNSFAGQYLTLLNVAAENLADAYRTVLAGKYTPQALVYRISCGLAEADTPMAVLALEMVDAAASGVMYTEAPGQPDTGELQIHATWGLGEMLADGRVSSDQITVAKSEPPEILARRCGQKHRMMVMARKGDTQIVDVPPERREQMCINDSQALALADWGMRIEAFFGRPQDIEWCTDSAGQLVLLQARPESSGDPAAAGPPECRFDDVVQPLLLSGGHTASTGIGVGTVVHAEDDNELAAIPEETVLVARHGLPRHAKIINKVSAVITEKGSIAGHLASVAREFSVPMVVNAAGALDRLTPGRTVTVWADGRKVYDGVVAAMQDSPCARRNPMADSPFMRRLHFVMRFVAPLRLVDPQAETFVPEGCRSLHDVIRFSHEMAVRTMFQTGSRRRTRVGRSKRLALPIPMTVYLQDLGGGLSGDAANLKTVGPENLTCLPFKALLRGLTHPDIPWGGRRHFDWAEYDKIVMSGGTANPEDAMFASHAVVAGDYANLNLRFGYHFAILDSICGSDTPENYIALRFSGGGADLFQRGLRADFLSRVLGRLEFTVERQADLVEARLPGGDQKVIEDRLDRVGRLLGATRLMDMYLKSPDMVDGFVQDFMDGRYHFATVAETR